MRVDAVNRAFHAATAKHGVPVFAGGLAESPAAVVVIDLSDECDWDALFAHFKGRDPLAFIEVEVATNGELASAKAGPPPDGNTYDAAKVEARLAEIRERLQGVHEGDVVRLRITIICDTRVVLRYDSEADWAQDLDEDWRSDERVAHVDRYESSLPAEIEAATNRLKELLLGDPLLPLATLKGQRVALVGKWMNHLKNVEPGMKMPMLHEVQDAGEIAFLEAKAKGQRGPSR